MKIAMHLSVLTLLLLAQAHSYASEFGPTAAKKVRQEASELKTESQKTAWSEIYTGPALDLAIPVFDPGIPNDPSIWEAKGIWPELRRAEAVWYSKKMAETLRETGIFNSVLVVPDSVVSADLYLVGELVESNGEDLQIDLELFATTGKKLMKKKKVRSRVSEDWYVNPRTQNEDPYKAAYQDAANDILAALLKVAKKDEKLRKKNERYIEKNKLKKVKTEALEEVRLVRHALYGQALSSEEFDDVTKVKRGVTKLVYQPDITQDNWRRVNSIVLADKKFNQLMDGTYDELTESMSDAYRTWQKDAYPIAKGQREARAAANRAAVGALLGVVVAASVGSNSGSTAGQVAAATVATASVAAAINSFKKSEESKLQADQLNELGNSVSSVMSPKVISMENREVELTGTASEQQAQWSGLLREMYDEGVEDFGGLEIVASTQ